VIVHFQVHRPAALHEALALLAEADQAPHRRPLAYGSDVLVWLKTRQTTAQEVVDVSNVEELRLISEDSTGFFLGAALSVADVGRHPVVQKHFPALAQAVHHMGSVQLREGASLGGNICTSSPAGDTAPPLLAYGARFLLANAGGERPVAAADFYRGPGQNSLTAGELLRGVLLPWPATGTGAIFLKAARRAAVDLALASVAVVTWPEPQAPGGIDAALAMGAVAPTPRRAPQAEALLRRHGAALDEEQQRELAQAVGRDSHPIDDVRATAHYRRTLVGQLAVKAVKGLYADGKGR
jgi:carbon-monoxide dehydrogenase medium subunit